MTLLEKLVSRLEVQTAKKNLSYFGEYAFKEYLPDYSPGGAIHQQWYDELQFNRPNRTLTIAPRFHAKSTCYGVILPLWEIGNDHNQRWLLVGKTSTVADALLYQIKQNIENNPRIHDVFPDLKPSQPWTTGALQVQREILDKSPSISSVGLYGSVTGRRASHILCDDLIDRADVLTEARRKKVWDWFTYVLLPVLDRNGQMIMIGTRWHPKDIYATLMENPEWKDHVKVYPALLGKEPNQVPLWPERYTVENLLRRRNEMGSLVFDCQMMNNPVGMAGNIFKGDWLHYYNSISPEFSALWRKLHIYMGVDPAISEDPEADFTAIAVMGVDPDTRDVYLIEIIAEHLNFPDQAKLIYETWQRYKTKGNAPLKIGIESVAYQKALSQVSYVAGLPCVEVKVTADKITRMLGLAPNFENGRIKLPDPSSVHLPWLEDFITEYLTFPNGVNDDRMDAVDHAFTVADLTAPSVSFRLGPP